MMGYTIDVYRRQAEPCRVFVNFALYVAYFPQLVAGPIERAKALIPQIAQPRSVSPDMIHIGLRLIFWGYFKKVFIADGVAPYVNECFNNPTTYGGVTLLMGAYLFAIQIYGDFSGYTDIARGISRLFGIELCLNFRQPYLATSVTEFWRRWHISLSAWLRDYLYIPLGGNRKGTLRTYVNNMLTMLLGGLWHGAAWNFIIWGGLHGCYLAVHKFLLGRRKTETQALPETRILGKRLHKLLCILGTFHLICFAWIFFRAESFSVALTYLVGIVSWSGERMSGISTTFVFYGLCVLLMDVYCIKNQSEVPLIPKPGVLFHPVFRGFVYAVALFLMVFVGGSNPQPFIYFQF